MVLASLLREGASLGYKAAVVLAGLRAGLWSIMRHRFWKEVLHLLVAGSIVGSASLLRGGASLGRKAAAAPTRLGAGLWSTLRYRMKEEALRLQIARRGEDLLLALEPLPARCEALLACAEQVVQTHHLNAPDQRSLFEEPEGYLGRTRDLQRQVQRTLQNLAALRGRDLETRSSHLEVLDAEICLLLDEISEQEALWRSELYELAVVSLPRAA